VKSIRRSRLTEDRCQDLVYIYNNARLLAARKNKQEPVPWDDEFSVSDDEGSEIELEEEDEEGENSNLLDASLEMRSEDVGLVRDNASFTF
jgi:hypothetical protein